MEQKMKIILAIMLIATAVGQANEIRLPTLTIKQTTYTNCTFRILNSTNGILRFPGGGARIDLADLPEPLRSQYYDEDKVARERHQIKITKEKRAKEKEEAAQRLKLAQEEANKPRISNEWIELSKPVGQEHRFGGMEITGTLKNKSNRVLRSVSISYSIYDRDDNKIDEARDYISSLDPGESWKFEASSLSKAGKFSLDRITSKDGRLDL